MKRTLPLVEDRPAGRLVAQFPGDFAGQCDLFLGRLTKGDRRGAVSGNLHQAPPRWHGWLFDVASELVTTAQKDAMLTWFFHGGRPRVRTNIILGPPEMRYDFTGFRIRHLDVVRAIRCL